MKTLDVVNSRLIFVSGKGGVGKTCLAASIGKTSASLGKKTLIIEVDNFHPSFTPIFGKKNKYEPISVEKNLDMCNVTWPTALEDWLVHTIHLKSIVHLVLSNRIAMLFLNATPGAREIVILSKILTFLDQYETVIVDLPASGHALGILKVPQTAIRLMRTGPIHERARQIQEVFSSPKATIVLSALPEEMVINETLEFYDKIKKEIPYLKNITIFLNRTAIPSFTEAEAELLEKLEEKAKEHIDWQEYVLAGFWEKDLEKASQRAIERVEEKLGYSVFQFPRLGLLGGFGGGTQKVVQQMTSALIRKVRKEAGR